MSEANSTKISVKRDELERFLNETLQCQNFRDYGPNGLQIEGKDNISKIAFAVSATRDSVERATRWQADAMIVHHGLFWVFHGPRAITKAFAKRVKPLIQNDINLFGFHLPLDAHTQYGNAAGICQKLDLNELAPFGDYKGSPTGLKGLFKKPIKACELQGKLKEILNHDVILSSPNPEQILKSMAIITGGANGGWVDCVPQDIDSYLTGEMSEHDWHEAKESGVHMFAGGHNATEQFGVQLLKELIEETFGVETKFFPSENPA